MGNSGNSGNQIIDDKTTTPINDNSSTVSLNGSTIKDKLNTSWKFSTLNDEDDKENENYNFKNAINGTGAVNEKKKLIIADDDDDEDENYDSTCEDEEEEAIVVVKDKLNLNSILHIDDHVEDDYDGIGYQHIQHHQNLSTSSASASSGSTSATASPERPEKNEEERANDTIENLAFSLLNKLTFDAAAAATAPSTLDVPIVEPIPPPPCTPVNAILDEPGHNILEKLLNSTSNKPQLIIDDVLLMSHEDGRPVAPLVEPEESFNASRVEPPEQQPEPKSPTVDHENQLEHPISIENTAFMTLINKIAPHSHLIEHQFEYEVTNPDELEHVHDVKLTGSFNNWQQFLPMIKDTKFKNKWHKSLMLAPGDYEYKFVINNQDWKCNTNMPVNGLNNYLNLNKN